ncbi:chalcone isomerase-like protein [Nitzschia inconspicua]|uniref:Chalcone isomerase-like protein n=1 Tax=Nitzschia inconspicua TaxID=303405 RepID=A0A9K3PKY5_9STRA|nr:chalcone isomerase-like protein [Nitzschia inconspicua]
MVLGAVLQLFHFGDDSGSDSVADAATTSDSPYNDSSLLSLSSSTSATTTVDDKDVVVVEGIVLPPARLLADDGIPLYRNGHGIRSIPFFGMNIKVYVAHLYSRRPLNENDALALIDVVDHNTRTSATPHLQTVHDPQTVTQNHTQNHHHHHHNPLHFDFTFLRHVGQSRVVSAWTQQLEHSVTHRYDGYEQDRDRFIQLFSTGHIEHGGTQTVQLVGDETRIIDQGHHKGTIVGREFQKSFLSMWVGPKAVAEDLKQNLFQGHQRPKNHGTECGTESEWIPLSVEESRGEATPLAA